MVTLSVELCLLVLVFSIILIWYIQFLWKRRNLYIYSRKVHGPFSFPILGSFHLFLGNPSGLMDRLIKLQMDYPGLCRLWLGPRLIYLVQDPEHIEKILTNPKCLDKDYLYKFISCLVGTGLMTAPAAKWRKHRRAIMPSFNQRILDSFVEVFAEQSVIFAEQLMKHVGKKNIDLFLLVSRCTLDIICETAMGVKMNNQTTNSNFGTNLDKIMEITVLRIFRIWHHLDFMWKLYPMSRELNKCVKVFRDVTEPIIKKKTEEFEQKKASEQSSLIAEIEEGTNKKRLAFLDLILENSNFTEEELREEVDIFLIAGTDTTASSMCCLFAILGLFQDVQQKVYEEVVEILGEDRIAVASDLPNLKYTERVIKESLRLFPVAAYFLRTIGEDVDLGDAILPAGSSAYFGSVPIHRNPKYWPNPMQFDPDRFLPEEIAKRPPGTYIAFSMGTRNCIGARYAMMNMKTILSTVIRRYKIFTEYKSIEEIELKTNIVLRLKDGPKVSLELR